MKTYASDPVIWVCIGSFLIGLIGFFWAIGKFRQMKPGSSEPKPDDLFPPAADLREIDFRAPAAAAVTTPPVAPGVNKDVAARLESMTQRLAEMQSVLTKQSEASGQNQNAAAGGVGQGFSPETIDKLLKIIGNVIQQVDVLQKSLKL